MNCKICGSNRIKKFKIIGEFHLNKCKDCKIIFLQNSDELTSSKNLYDKNYFEDYLYENQVDFDNFKLTAKYYLDYIKHYFGEIKSVLDVGAGFGLFVKAFREFGVRAEGVEISKYGVQIAKEKFGIDLYNGELDKFNSSEKFDLICFYHSFEHIPNPVQTLQAAKNLLSEKGVLWLSLPNVMSLDRLIKKENWNGWSLPFHFFHYSPKSIKNLLYSNGFSKIKIQKAFLNPIRLTIKKSKETELEIGFQNFSKTKEMIRGFATLFLSGQNMNVFAQK